MKVKCIKGYPDIRVLKKDEIYEVALIVKKAKIPQPYRTRWESGYVLLNPTCKFPYIWNKKRFEIIEK